MSVRRRPVFLLTAIILIAVFSPWTGAQQRGGNPTSTTPQRGGTTQTQPGVPQSGLPNTQTSQQSGSVTGTVGQVGVGIPIKRATVTFNRLATPTAGGANVVAADSFGTNSPNSGGGRGGGGGGGGGNRSVQADNNGMYTITGLAEGQYRVIASAAGFVTQEYGQASFDSPGTPVNVTAGSPQTIDFQLIAGGLIEGTVLDDDGVPIVGGQVQLYAADYTSGQRMLVPTKNAQTDDVGGFRLPALDPGDYYLAASPSSAQAFLPPDTAVPQSAIGVPGRGPGGPQQGGRGGRNGRNGQQAAANGQPSADQPVAPPMRAYAPTFFPGTTDTAQAAPVQIAPGFQAHGININLKPVTLITIKGSVIVPTGFAPAATPQPQQQPNNQQQNGNGGAGRGAGNQTGGGNRGTGGTGGNTGGGAGGGARGGNNLAAQGRGGRGGGGNQAAPGNATPGNGAPTGNDNNAAGGRGGRGGPGGPGGDIGGGPGGFNGGGGGGASVTLMPIGIRAGSGGRGGGGGGGGRGGPGGDFGGGGGRGGGGGGGRGNNFAAQGPGGRGGGGGRGGPGGFGQDFGGGPGGGPGGGNGQTAVGGTQSTRVSANDDGTFQIDNVLPGSYVVFAEARSNNVQMTAYNRLDVAYGNIDNYTLALRPGMTVPGQIYYDSQQLPENFQPRSIQISLAPMDNLPIGSARATVSDDNKFTFSNVAPGRYRLTANVSQSSGGYAVRALFGGTDALTDVFPLDSEDTPLQILVGFTQGRIDAMTEQTGKPFPGARVLLAPATRSRLDLFRVASADKDGKASFANVPPGNYKLFAWESLAKSNAYQDPRFLEEYEDHGRPVSIDKSGTVTENHLQVMPATH